MIGELQETGVDRVEPPLQRHHELDAGLLADASQLACLVRAGRERLLLQHVDMVPGRRFDDLPTGVMRHRDDHQVEILLGEHLPEIGIPRYPELVPLLPDDLGVLIADGDQFRAVTCLQAGDVIIKCLLSDADHTGPQDLPGTAGCCGGRLRRADPGAASIVWHPAGPGVAHCLSHERFLLSVLNTVSVI